MGQTAAALGVGVEIKVGNKTYTVASPFTYEVQAKFENWLADRAMMAVLHRKHILQVGGDYGPALAAVARDVATFQYDFLGEAAQKAANTDPGTKRLFLYCLQVNHPEVGEEFVESLVNERREEIVAKIQMAGTTPEADDPNLKAQASP